MERQSSSVYLRALELADLDRVLAWHNDPALYACLGGGFRYVSRAAEEEWLRQRCAYSTAEVNLAICVAATGEHIGNASLRDIDWTSRHAELHMFIGPAEARRRGHGKSALRLLLAHAFADLGLERVYLFVLASNEAAVRLYETCGFRQEGRLRGHAFKQGRREDLLAMGLLRAEWPE